MLELRSLKNRNEGTAETCEVMIDNFLECGGHLCRMPLLCFQQVLELRSLKNRNEGTAEICEAVDRFLEC